MPIFRADTSKMVRKPQTSIMQNTVIYCIILGIRYHHTSQTLMVFTLFISCMLNWAMRTSWGWWDEWDGTALRYWIWNLNPGGRARFLLVTDRLPTIRVDAWRKKHFCFFQTAETGERTPNSSVKGSGANHYPRAPVHIYNRPPRIIYIS